MSKDLDVVLATLLVGDGSEGTNATLASETVGAVVLDGVLLAVLRERLLASDRGVLVGFIVRPVVELLGLRDKGLSEPITGNNESRCSYLLGDGVAADGGLGVEVAVVGGLSNSTSVGFLCKVNVMSTRKKANDS